MIFDDEMMKALEADGAYLEAMTGEFHGPVFIEGVCPKCDGTGAADSGGTHPWGQAIFIPCDCGAAD